jgi:hypothetical protein
MPRRKRKVDLGRYRAPESREPPTVDELVDEGVMIAASATRMAATNLGILRVLRQHEDYDGDWFAETVREQLHAIGREKAEDARRVAREVDTAQFRGGLASHQSDYRLGDVDNLERRQEMLERLSERLDELAADDAYVDEMADAVKQHTWDEIGLSIEDRALRGAPHGDLLSEDERKASIVALRSDLRRQLRKKGR